MIKIQALITKIIYALIIILYIYLLFFGITTIPGLNGDSGWFISKSIDIEKNGLTKNITGMNNYTGILHPYLIYLTNTIFNNYILSGQILNIIFIIITFVLSLHLLKDKLSLAYKIILFLLISSNSYNFWFNKVIQPHCLFEFI